MEAEDLRHARLTAVLAYIWVPGWIIALLLNGQRRSVLGAYHLRQALGWMLTGFLLFWLIRFRLVALAVTLLGSVYGILNALQDELRPIPVVGPLFDKWFRPIL